MRRPIIEEGGGGQR